MEGARASTRLREACGRSPHGWEHPQTDTLSGQTTDWLYAYDSGGRLSTVTKNGTQVSQYGYDSDDNRTTYNGSVVGTYDNQDRLESYNTASYAYTANGELTSKTVGTNVTSYTYDALGNLLHVGFSAALGDGTTAVDYLVDAQNRRVGRKVNGTLVSGWLYQDQLRPVAQVDGSGTNVVARFVYGSKPNVPDYMITSGGTYRILSDHLGSPRLVVDVSSGAVIENNSFDEFGVETPTHGTLPTGYVLIPFGFAGGLYDPDTQLVRFGARDYDASVGRWTSKDPILFDGGQDNIYVYAGNDPVNTTDANGRDGDDSGDGGGGDSPAGDQCREPYKCSYFDVINTGGGTRCAYNCKTSTDFRCITRPPVVGPFCPPTTLIEAGLNELGSITPEYYNPGPCKKK